MSRNSGEYRDRNRVTRRVLREQEHLRYEIAYAEQFQLWAEYGYGDLEIPRWASDPSVPRSRRPHPKSLRAHLRRFFARSGALRHNNRSEPGLVSRKYWLIRQSSANEWRWRRRLRRGLRQSVNFGYPPIVHYANLAGTDNEA